MSNNFDSIAGYKQEKEVLKRLCEIFKNRKKYNEKGAKLPKGIIFYGDAGSGKTLFSKVMAEECGLKIMKIDVADLENETSICKNIKETFREASKQNEPVMIFFDELDKFLPDESEDYVTDRTKSVLVQLLTLIDGMDSSKNIVFVATCNDYESLPETITRPGRIDKKIGLDYPDYESRLEILKYYAGKSSCKFEIPFEEIATLCSGFSCAGIETFVNECILQSDENGFVCSDLIIVKIYEIKNENIPRENPKIDDKIRACFNIGSFVVAKALSDSDYFLTLDSDTVCNNLFDTVISFINEDYDSSYNSEDDYDDYEEDNSDDEEDDDWDYDDDWKDNKKSDTYFSKLDYLNAITAILGGYASEEVIFNKVYDNVEDSLDTIDEMLLKMASNGLFGLNFRYNTSRLESLKYSQEYTNKINDLFSQTINDCYEKAKKIIEKNEDLIKKLIPILVVKKYLNKDECDFFIEGFINNKPNENLD